MLLRQLMLLRQFQQALDDCCVACPGSSRLYALAIGIESTYAHSSLVYPAQYFSYPSLDFCCHYRLYCHYHLCHPSLHKAALLERVYYLFWLQLPFRQAWWRSHQAWRSLLYLYLSWAPGRHYIRHSLGSLDGGRRWVPAHSSGRLSLQCRYCHRCHWWRVLIVLRRDCESWFSDQSVMHSCQHHRSPARWSSKGLA